MLSLDHLSKLPGQRRDSLAHFSSLPLDIDHVSLLLGS